MQGARRWTRFALICFMHSESRSSLRYDSALLVVVLIWGLNFPIIKVPLEVMHPFTVNLFRFVVSAMVLGGIWLVEARRTSQSFTAVFLERPGSLIGLGMVGQVGYQVLFILGVSKTGAGNAALIIASSPMWTALLGHLFGIEQLRSRQWGGLVLSFAGVAIVVLAGSGALVFSNTTLLGNVLMMLGAIFWALYTVLSRPILTRGTPPLALTFFGVLAALPILGGLGIFTLNETLWESVSAITWLALLFSGGLSTGLAYALWNIAVRRLGPSQTAAFSNLVPFVALVATYFLFGEPITGIQISGGILIVGGLVVLRRF